MEPVIQNCYYRSNYSDSVAAQSNLDAMPPSFPPQFVVENGVLLLRYTLLCVNVGTGTLRSQHTLEYSEAASTPVIQNCVCYRTSSPEFANIVFQTRQAETVAPSRFYRLSALSNGLGEDYLLWFASRYEERTFQASYSVTNLLGSAGSFKTDSNRDGLSDSWTTVGSPSCTLVNDGTRNWQVIRVTYTSGEQGICTSFSASTNRTCFVRMLQRVSTTDLQARMAGSVQIFSYFSNTSSGFPIMAPSADDFGKTLTRFGSFTLKTSSPSVVIYAAGSGSNPGSVYEVQVAEVAVYDLDQLGNLPADIAEFLGATKWKDLATSEIVRGLDGTEQSGLEWLGFLLPYVEGTGSVNYFADSPFRHGNRYYYKAYLFTYDPQYNLTVQGGELTWQRSPDLVLTHVFEGRTFSAAHSLKPDIVNLVELVAVLPSTEDALTANDILGTTALESKLTSPYSFYERVRDYGLWYFDRANWWPRLYGPREVLLIRRDGLDRLDTRIQISEAMTSQVYITPFTRSGYALIFVPDERDVNALRRAGLSEVFWKVSNERFVIDSRYWYALYINLLEEFASPEDDKYTIENGFYLVSSHAIPFTTDAFSVEYRQGKWFLVFDRDKLTDQSEEFYCVLQMRDLMDNLSSAFVVASGYVEYGDELHKDWLRRFKLTRTKFTFSGDPTLILLGKYVQSEQQRTTP